MPVYSFENSTDGKIEEHVMTISELDQFKKDNPHLTQVIVKFGGFVIGHGMKPDGVFRDMLKEIKKANPGSTVDTF